MNSGGNAYAGARANRRATDPPVRPYPQVLNRLLALATGGDPQVTRELHRAIEFSLREGSLANEASVLHAARRLLSLQHGDTRSFAVAHCDLRGLRDEPLWMRQRALAALRRLAGHRDAVLLVTGLKPAFCPTGSRWSRKRACCYRDFKAHLEQLAMRYSAPQTRLRLLYF